MPKCLNLGALITGALLTIAAIAMTNPQPAQAQAQNFPTVITPLSTVSDLNGVNVTNALISIPIPALAVPAAPRLTVDRLQTAMPYLVARLGGSPVESSISVHTGGSSSEAFKCHNDDVCSNYKVNGSRIGGAIAAV